MIKLLTSYLLHVIEINAVDKYGIEDNYYPVEFSQNGTVKKELKAGNTYAVSTDMKEGILYIAFYGADNKLLNVVSKDAEEEFTVTSLLK